MRSRLDRIQNWPALARDANYNATNLARLCKVSARQLQRFWRDAHGEAPQAWLNRFRLRLAGPLLQQGFSVKEVAHALSFKQASHFCRVFKHRNGVTPGRFNGSRNGVTSRGVAPG